MSSSMAHDNRDAHNNVDALISRDDGRKYWEGVDATVDGSKATQSSVWETLSETAQCSEVFRMSPASTSEARAIFWPS